MDNFLVKGGRPARGEIGVGGSKNAALPILLSSILTNETVIVENVPDLMDIRSAKALLEYLGKDCSFSGGRFEIREKKKLKHKAPYNMVRKMRASVLVMGPLLARFGHARVALPGGCSIGVRPVDIHLDSFRKLGANLYYKNGDEMMFAGNMRGGRVRFPFPSVGATENMMMCASLLEGETLLENCAREPEISDLAAALRKMGAEVSGEGTSRIRIRGKKKLYGMRHRVIPDRIETATFLVLAAITGGRLRLRGGDDSQVEKVLECLERSGAEISVFSGGISVKGPARPRPVSVSTGPYPGFPTDVQPLWTAYMALSSGSSRVTENIFENRFIYAAELMRMGADIRIEGKTAKIRGVRKLVGAPVMASDIRAGAALVVACCAAEGRSVIRRIYHIDRGYERMERKLRAAGMDIIRRKNA